VQPDEPCRRALRLAGVEAHADPNFDSWRPGLRGERALRLDGGGDGLERVVEEHEERVALRALLAAAVARDRLAHDRGVALQHRRVGVAAELGEEARGALDVGEQECQRAAATRGRGGLRGGGVWGQCRADSVTSRRRAATPRRMASVRAGCSSRTFSKSHEARARQLVSTSAATVALRGIRSRTDSSPKNSPAPRYATIEPSRTTRTMPEITTKKPVPMSPSRAITCPAGKSTGVATSARCARPVASM